jgi:hypothetical protein
MFEWTAQGWLGISIYMHRRNKLGKFGAILVCKIWNFGTVRGHIVSVDVVAVVQIFQPAWADGAALTINSYAVVAKGRNGTGPNYTDVPISACYYLELQSATII